MASRVSRPRLTVARKTTSPRSLRAGDSTPESVPDDTPGAEPPLSAPGGEEDALHGLAAGHRRRKGHRAGLVERGDGVPAEARERAHAGHGIALSSDPDDPVPRAEEESLPSGAAMNGGEEGDLSPAIGG